MIGIDLYTLVVVAGNAQSQSHELPATTTSVYGSMPIIGAGKFYLGNAAINSKKNEMVLNKWPSLRAGHSQFIVSQLSWNSNFKHFLHSVEIKNYHKPCGQGRGIPEKTMFFHVRGREGQRLVHMDKTFCGDPFFVHEFKKSCENFKKNFEYVNENLVSPFELL